MREHNKVLLTHTAAYIYTILSHRLPDDRVKHTIRTNESIQNGKEKVFLHFFTLQIAIFVFYRLISYMVAISKKEI